MENILAFLTASIIFILFTFIDAKSHQKFNKRQSLVFHVIGLTLIFLLSGWFFISVFKLTIFIIPGLILILIGSLIIIKSYGKIKKDFLRAGKIQITGLYSKVRHPMYMGIIIFLAGLSLVSYSLYFLAYAFIISLCLIWMAKIEEKHMARRFWQNYENYKKQVPMLVPKIY